MFPKDSSFGQQELAIGRVELPKPGEIKVGEIKRVGVVEVPIEELEACYRDLDSLMQADFRHSNNSETYLKVADVRDQIYRWLR